jgi:hypothetical protein
MNDRVIRYYKIKASGGPVQTFSLDIAPQPGIEIQSIKAGTPDSPGTPTASEIHLHFGSRIPIQHLLPMHHGR